MNLSLNPQKGFRDLMPTEKAIQDYIFDTLKNVARLNGFAPYDGPLLEDINLYLNKSSEELVTRQTFQVKDKKDQTLVMRPEMTPSLARMVAKNAHTLTFPVRLFNLGLRYRYEAPQKGREREFYQVDFDLLGSSDVSADAEILAVATNIFTALGATDKDFVIYVNSRSVLQSAITEMGYAPEQYKPLLGAIDRQDKISNDAFMELLMAIDSDKSKSEKLVQFLKSASDPSSDYFKNLFTLLESYGISQFCKINYNIVRGLDYYTGLVFEVKELEGGEPTGRSLLGGGRYDNLVSSYDEKLQIPGVGFATSDVVLWSFLKDKNLLPAINLKKQTVLVTLFDDTSRDESAKIVSLLRAAGVSAELYPDMKKLDKQLKYGSTMGFPFVLILGPDELEKGTVMVKDMGGHSQETVGKEDLVKYLTSKLKPVT